MCFDKTYIITNANESWVQHCITINFPSLEYLFKQFTIISARSLYQTQFPYPQVFEWKLHTFHHIMKDIQGKSVVVSIGDSNAERYALLMNAKSFSDIIPITIKFDIAPNLADLQNEIIAMYSILPNLANKKANYEITKSGEVLQVISEIEFPENLSTTVFPETLVSMYPKTRSAVVPDAWYYSSTY